MPHAGRAMVEFPPECDVLAGHVIKRAGSIPRFVRVPRIFGEVRRAGGSRRAIAWRQQHQIAPLIVNLSSSDPQTLAVMVKPKAIVEHQTQKTLFPAFRGISGAAHASAVFASDITCQ